MEITCPGGLVVEAHAYGHTIRTDQPKAAGGDDSAPAPFDLFLASIGTCIGYYAVRFCREREIDTDGLRVKLEPLREAKKGPITTIRIQMHLPKGFPDKYRQAVLRAADQCAVKRHIVDPPSFELSLT